MVSYTKTPPAGRISAPPRALAQSRSLDLGPAALFVALLFAAAALVPAARAEAGDPLALDLFLNIAADPLVDLGNGFAEPALTSAGRTLIGGVPLNLAVREESADVLWRMVTGANVRYTLGLTDQLSVTGSGRFAKTDFADMAAPGKIVTTAATDFTYAAGRWTFDLQPWMELVRADTGVTQRDAIMEGRASRALTDRLSLSGIARYRWREMIGPGTTDSGIAYGRLGFVCSLTELARADLGYMSRQETFATGSVTRSTGPSLILSWPVEPNLDLAAKYEYTATARDSGDAVAATSKEDLHQLGLALTWGLRAERTTMELSAAYKLERFDPPGAPGAVRHLGRVNFAVNF